MKNTDDLNALKYMICTINTKLYENEFLECLKMKDNRRIENTPFYKLLDEMITKKSDFLEILKAETIIYRSRIVDINDEKIKVNDNQILGLDQYDSKEPPISISPNGRNNLFGASYLYAVADKYTSVVECKPTIRSFLSVAELKVKKDLRIFNLSEDVLINNFKSLEKEMIDISKAITSIMRYFYVPVSDTEHGYFVTQYIADLVRKNGYDGIAYKSYLSDGKNYTIFNCSNDNIAFQESNIVLVQNISLQINALNDGSNIESKNKMTISKEDLLQLKQEIIKQKKIPRAGQGTPFS